jgi:hypothetical protein
MKYITEIVLTCGFLITFSLAIKLALFVFRLNDDTYKCVRMCHEKHSVEMGNYCFCEK